MQIDRQTIDGQTTGLI